MYNIIVCGPGDETECGKKLILRHRFHEYSVQLVLGTYMMQYLKIVSSTVYPIESVEQATTVPDE